MKLIWKLLRRHMSIVQFAGFFLTNLIGIAIILSALQVYRDISELYSQPDSFMKNDYIIISKKVNTLKVLGLGNTEFSADEINGLREQPFVRNTGNFTPALYQIKGSVGMAGMHMSTYMFFESVPDGFIDVKSDAWEFREGDRTIPIIIPRNYLNLYNYGFAQSQGLPQISQELFGVVELDLRITGNGHREEFNGHIVGFSNRLNTILVPQSFIDWSNARFSPGEQAPVSRVIIEVDNAADKKVYEYLSAHGYETEGEQLDAGKTAYLMRIITGIVIGVGILITILSFFILMLSIFLLLQKNTEKLRNLILLGYTPSRVSLPYKLLTIGLNTVSFISAVAFIVWLRGRYMPGLSGLYPNFESTGITATVITGFVIIAAVSLINCIAISRKTAALWKSE